MSNLLTIDRVNLNGLVERSFNPIFDLPLGLPVQHQECGVEVHFADLEETLCRLIRGADRVIGCVSWLTSIPVLDALAGCEAVSVIVQKEEFLRPDLLPGDGWRKKLRALYGALPGGFDPFSFDLRFTETAPAASIDLGVGLEPVRCCGIVDKGAANVPRMHHKFFVFFKRLVEPHPMEKETGRAICIPVAVWTGSFNPSANGTRSLDNAVTLIPTWTRDMQGGLLSERGFGDRMMGCVCNQYIEEWARVLGVSDPLQWEFSDLPEEA
jgi:hypothetical protein